MTIEDDDINIHFGVEFDSGGLRAEGMAVYLGVAVGTLPNWSLPSGVNMELVRTKTSMIFTASNKKQSTFEHFAM